MALVGLGVSGGIGAYKAVEVARLLQKRGHRVQAVMTRTAPAVGRSILATARSSKGARAYREVAQSLLPRL